MSTNVEPSKLIRVGGPLTRVKLTFQPATSGGVPEGAGPMTTVSRPPVRGRLRFEPVVSSAELTVPAGSDGTALLEALAAAVGHLNTFDELAGRAGVWVDDARSGVRDGAVVVVVSPNDPEGAVETCKRVADFLFAAVRTIPGARVRVVAADPPGTVVYEVAA